MTEHNKPEQADLTSPSPIAAAPSVRRSGLFVSWLGPAALAGVLVLGGLQWQGGSRIEAMRVELAQRVGDSETAQRDTVANARQNREALDALQAKVGALEARLAQVQGQQMALDAMYQELSRVRDDRLLAEIEQGVAIAAQQLQLAGNVEAALIALQGADARLARSAQPQFLPLRKLISRDLERLRALPGADVPGIALKLDNLMNVLSTLPLAFEQRPAVQAGSTAKDGKPATATAAPAAKKLAPAADAFDWQGMARSALVDLWQELRQLVRIERIDHPDPGLLSPREIFFLRENLRLRLLSARLALLGRDARSFHADLRQAGEWLDRYFDGRAPAVRDAATTLRELGKLDVMRVPPALDETLFALRNFKLSRERATAR